MKVIRLYKKELRKNKTTKNKEDRQLFQGKCFMSRQLFIKKTYQEKKNKKAWGLLLLRISAYS